MEETAKKKVLIVDDDEKITDLLSDFCADFGYDTKAVNQSTQAVAIAQEWQPNIITLDLEMPEMDGVEVLKRLKANPPTARIPVLIISVVARDAALSTGAAEGRFDKPIKFRRLFEKIEALLQIQSA